ncbi:alpha/beta hydrolase [Lactiplantibacillus plantarum]|uniref:alpha/beta hydrolase n=1 Tax=Lactiplantibacillus plantarum TaxID=1590 RepID=UPI0007B55351|nr:alpha/beta hydrolase-fold protein [Lactiplantibacillus plantarum]KZU44375.1 acetylesterase [Lactiplantibacillus plantarum]KZU46320.1 acetylesterase [Lactiplantibacillus plantarum]QBA79658.1 acetylesterase [Lactiplantibacillus plantarum]
MALIRINFMVASLHRTVPLMVCLPTDKLVPDEQGVPRPIQGPFATLYLLHGILGSEVDWISGTRIQRWADERNLAVVMPAGENSFYTDHPWSGETYSQFIGQELIDFTRRTFPLSHQRDQTFIGGLSMGGYGALYNGLKFHDTFGAIVSLSAGLNVRPGMEKLPAKPQWFAETVAYQHGVFGPDLAAAGHSELNLQVLVTNLLAAHVVLPAIFMAIGDQDGLKSANDEFDHFLTTKKVSHEYLVGSGAHEWDFWDRYLLKALNWLPLTNQGAGVNSGHIKVN